MSVKDVILLTLLIAAFVLAALAAVGIGHPRLHLGWAAFALVILTWIIDKVAT